VSQRAGGCPVQRRRIHSLDGTAVHPIHLPSDPPVRGRKRIMILDVKDGLPPDVMNRRAASGCDQASHGSGQFTLYHPGPLQLRRGGRSDERTACQ
jgi:hypothetical protein